MKCPHCKKKFQSEISENLKQKVLSYKDKALSLREIEKLTSVNYSSVRRILNKERTR